MKSIYEFESIEDYLKPKTKQEILSSLNARDDAAFKLSKKTQNGTYFLHYYSTSYKNLVSLFGLPNSKGDNYKKTTEWILEDDKGNVVTIYDYKSTNKFYDEYPSVKEFRELDSYTWHIGGQNTQDANNLIYYIIKNTKSKNES